MNTALPAEVLAFGRSATVRLGALKGEAFSGAQYALAAESDVSMRLAAGQALEELGAFDIDPRGDLEEFLAACELSRVAGGLATPYPIVERQLAVDGAWLALIDARTSLVDHADLGGSWIAAALSGETYTALALTDDSKRKLAPFVRPVKLTAASVAVSIDDVSRHLVLGAWRALGTAEAALTQVSAHVQARHQFGKPLSDFQAVRFAIADVAVTVRGLSELSRYTAWRQSVGTEATRRADALALRLHAAESARIVLRTSHQLLGAVGFCDEHDVSVLDRHIQSTTRLPLTAERLLELLVPAVASEEFETLFTQGVA